MLLYRLVITQSYILYFYWFGGGFAKIFDYAQFLPNELTLELNPCIRKDHTIV